MAALLAEVLLTEVVTCGRTDAEVVFVDGQEFDKLW